MARLRHSLVAGFLVFIATLVAYKFGFRAKLQPLASHTTWRDVAQVVPQHVAFAILAGLIYYVFFWKSRNRR